MLNEALEFFDNQQHFYTEAALLSRVIYRVKMKLRSAKDLKAVEKVNRAVLNYLQIDIARVLRTFLNLLPQQYKAGKTYLPTKNMLHYVLVRLQGLSKLLIRITESCKIACDHSLQRIRLAHCWNMALILLGVLSRIFVICKNMIKHTCSLYGDLLPYTNKLSNIGVKWLPDNYVFPESLDKWLDIDWVDFDRAVIEIPDDKPPISFYLNLVDDSDVEVSDEYVLINDEPSICELSDDEYDLSQETTNLEENITELRGFSNDIDIGEVIEIDDSKNSSFIKLDESSSTMIQSDDSSSSSVIELNGNDGVVVIDDSINTQTKKKIKRKRKRNKLGCEFNKLKTQQTKPVAINYTSLHQKQVKKVRNKRQKRLNKKRRNGEKQ